MAGRTSNFGSLVAAPILAVDSAASFTFNVKVTKQGIAQMLTIATAKAYAEKITQGAATYARQMSVDGAAMIRVRVRLPSYRVAWVDCWIECGALYGEW